MDNITIESAEHLAEDYVPDHTPYPEDIDFLLFLRECGPCSICTDSFCPGRSIGSGCSECGYTGKRRKEFWVPSEIKGTK